MLPQAEERYHFFCQKTEDRETDNKQRARCCTGCRARTRTEQAPLSKGLKTHCNPRLTVLMGRAAKAEGSALYLRYQRLTSTHRRGEAPATGPIPRRAHPYPLTALPPHGAAPHGGGEGRGQAAPNPVPSALPSLPGGSWGGSAKGRGRRGPAGAASGR